MFVTCPECDRRFNALESATGKQVPCPDCDSLVTVPRRSKTGAEKKTPQTATTGKKKHGSAKTKPASDIDLRILIGGGAAAVVVVISLIIVLVRGFGGRGPAQAGGVADGKNPASQITATTVVFAEPLADAPGPETKTEFPRPEPVPVATAPDPKFADGATPAPAGDRTGLVATTPTPPDSWSALPKPPAPVQGLIGAYNVPNTPPMFGDAHVSFVAGFEPPADPKLTEKLRWDARSGKKDAIAQLQANYDNRRYKGAHWYRYDLRTGKYDGNPISLAPSDVGTVDFNQTATAMAMSRDGNRLALRHPTETSRVDVYEADGSRVLTFTPYAADVPVQWVSWSGSGRLLTLADGKLTGWSVPEGKVTFETEGSYHGSILQIRGNAWLAASVGEHIDLLDAETGACLGRCTLSGNDYDLSNFTAMAIAPGGTALFCHALHKQPDWGKVGVVFAWNLTTGQALPPAISEFPPFGFSAIDDHRLLLGGVYDVKVGVVYATYQVPRVNTYDWFPLPPRSGAPGACDDRFWTWGPEPGAEDSHRFMLRVIEYPGIIDSGPTSKQIFTKETPLTVEVDMGEKARSEAFGKSLLKVLQGQGFTIGKGDWTLRATCEVKSSETNLTMKGWSGGQVNVPIVLVHWKLYAPDGELAHSTGSNLQLGTGSKYFSGQRQVSQKGIEITLEFTWEFPNRNPREAIIDELLENLGTGGGGSDIRLPTPIGKFQGKYDLLPVTANAVFAPAPAPDN